MSLSPQQTQHNPLTEEDLWRQRLVAELSSILDEGISRLRANPDRTMAYMERGAQAIMREISGPMLDQLAERVDDELPRPGCCGASMEITNRRPREILSLVAANRPRRREYRCACCGRTVIPADEVLGFGPGKYSPELTRVVSANGAEIASFERATILVAETLGLSDLHVSTVTRTCQAMGASVEVGEQAARAALNLPSTVAEVPEAPIAAAVPSLLLGVDATKAHANGKWRDVKPRR